jgi:hypothetical protein
VDFCCFKMSKIPIGDSWKATGFAFRCFEDLNDVWPCQNAVAFESGRDDADTQPTAFDNRARGFAEAPEMGAPFFPSVIEEHRVTSDILPVDAGAEPDGGIIRERARSLGAGERNDDQIFKISSRSQLRRTPPDLHQSTRAPVAVVPNDFCPLDRKPDDERGDSVRGFVMGYRL